MFFMSVLNLRHYFKSRQVKIKKKIIIDKEVFKNYKLLSKKHSKDIWNIPIYLNLRGYDCKKKKY